MSDTGPSFISSNTGKVHRGTREDGPECGTRQKGAWASVDADDEEEAVMDYNLNPCTRCIERSYELARWRADVHSATVMGDVGTPERWRRKYDDFYTGDSA
ncbi:hypothetical protein [Haloarcula sp. JP-L23]|uniref:hypothetical protein n=1 Tax=Haloarcula sp. JP-L23 TaxID=2716717 RepID=UPI00140EED33|nr:hypothetical protein G9465_24740 [Haloarcula sp. JP-L23]